MSEQGNGEVVGGCDDFAVVGEGVCYGVAAAEVCAVDVYDFGEGDGREG